MQLTDIQINLCPHQSTQAANGSRLRAFCALTFDHTFVIRDVKLIEGNEGLFLAMPSRKICDHCARCGEKNHLRARYCNQCGTRLDEDRYLKLRPPFAAAGSRVKLHADVAHPINARCRAAIERQVFAAYAAELERSKQPGYVPPSLDAEDLEHYDPAPAFREDQHAQVIPNDMGS